MVHRPGAFLILVPHSPQAIVLWYNVQGMEQPRESQQPMDKDNCTQATKGVSHREGLQRLSGRAWKALLIGVGVLSVGLAVVGIFLPLLPTTPLLLLAVACFVRSSDRLHHWLINHRWFGTYLRNYSQYRAITQWTRVTTLILLWLTLGYTIIAVVDPWPLRVLLALIGTGVTIHLFKLKTMTADMILDNPADQEVPKN